MNKVSFGPASWIGLIGAIAAALAPLVSNLSGTTGAIISAALAAITVLGRQMQAITNTQYAVGADQATYVDELPTAPTDVQAG